MTPEQRRAQLKGVIEEIENLSEVVKGLVEGTCAESDFEAHGGFGFDTLLGNGNPYDSSLFNLLNLDDFAS